MRACVCLQPCLRKVVHVWCLHALVAIRQCVITEKLCQRIVDRVEYALVPRYHPGIVTYGGVPGHSDAQRCTSPGVLGLLWQMHTYVR